MLCLVKNQAILVSTVIVAANWSLNMDAILTNAEITAYAALDALNALRVERLDCIKEGRPLRPISIRIRWAKAECKRLQALAGVKVTA